MTELLKDENTRFLSQLENSLDSYLAQQGDSKLSASMRYSLKSKGKRFRPFLSYLVMHAFGKSFESVKTWCLAIEFIHTYSLIHDDLPCMDNDDLRRGLPTNHKVFGEDIALLAGDSLISEAFKIISEDNSISATTRVNLIQLLAEKIGPAGMVGGQVLDMQAKSHLQIEELKHLHILKTGNLIQAAALGSGIILELATERLKHLQEFALHLGLSFQIKDDLLDFKTEKTDFKNYVQVLGHDIAQSELAMHSAAAMDALGSFDNNDVLKELIHFNLTRAT